MQYQTEAILIAARDWGEADKAVTLFSREFGKISAFANGARRPKNRLAGAMQLFQDLDLTMMSGKTFDSVKQADIRQPFRHMREDLLAMAYGMFLAEIIAELCPERQPEPRVFDVFQAVLPWFKERNPRVLALAAAWQILAALGYEPQVERCSLCGQATIPLVCFSVQQGGALCRQCAVPGLPVWEPALGELLSLLLALTWEEPQRFTVNGGQLVALEQILLKYLQFQLDKPLKSVQFIRQLAAMPPA